MANTLNTGAGTTTQGDATGGMAGSARGEGAAIVGGPTRVGNEGPGPRLMTASTLEGDEIVNRQGDTLGELEEIMLDVTTGRVAYAVMSAGGFLGMGEKLFAVPWSALTLDTARKCFVLDIPKQRFEEAPGFDKDHWPSMADHQWATQVHDFYGVRPYWTNRLQ